MFKLLANLTDRRSWMVVMCAVVFAGVAGYYGSPVASLMTDGDGDFDDPASESVAAEERLSEAADANPGADVIALIDVGESVKSPAGREKVREVAEVIGDDRATARVLSYFETGEEAMISESGESTYVIASFDPDADDGAAVERLQKEFADDEAITLGGGAVVGPQVGGIIGEDLARAEMLAFPILFVLLLWIFRGLVAALLPLLVGGLAIVGTFLGLRLVTTEITPLSVYAVNLVTGLGLGLAIDYSLFIVSRYREEIASTGPGREALLRTLSTAGRTVLFSSLTVAVALASLLVFPIRFLYSMGVGGMLVSLIAAVVALVVLPAILSLLGERVNALSFGRWRRAAETEARSAESTPFYRISHAVMRRPVVVAVATSVLLVTLGLPFLGIKLTSVDASVLPKEASARQVDEALEEEFPPGQESPIYLAVKAPDDDPRETGQRLGDYAADLEDLPNVEAVSQPRPVGEDAWQIDVTPAAGAFSEKSKDLVRDVRALEAPYPVEAGGLAAAFVDQQDALLESLPYALAVVFASTLVLLFLFTGSVVLPIKTFLMNTLTVGATFGILVWIFQQGRLENLLGYESQGALDNTQPILVLIMAFGLSTDYGVFLLSRIKEARDSGAHDTEAVAVGLGRTGRIITAAALLFCIAIGAFATSQIVIIKELGVGAALAVLIDATIVRALLVPSLMKLLGRRNWWSPKPLRWLHEHIGLSENAQTGRAPVELGSPNRTMLGIRASGQPFDRDTSNAYAKEER
ncbi:MAG: MMPL family transporter [Actinomycetota bacterium]|nr:MMPL family transporter [Actinomycetota bacterium]